MSTRGSSVWRREAWGVPCGIEPVAVPIYAGGPKAQVHPVAAPAFIQLGLVCMRHQYIVRRYGGYNCRKITGGTSYSAHAYGLAVDINDDTNPYRLDKLVTDMPEALIRDIYLIKTAGGARVFRWGGDWDGRPDTPNSNYDAMHFEVVASPEELKEGFSAEQPPEVAAPVYHWPVIRRGASGEAVRMLQEALGMSGTTGAGLFGPRTETAVKTYQASRGLAADGIVGLATWTALLTGQPPLQLGDPRPQKR